MAVAVHLLSKCNANCEFCYTKNMKGTMSLSLFEKVCKLFTGHQKRMLLTGGEPLLRDDLGEIIDIAKGYEFRISISTNGSIINEDAFKANSIQISLDYYSDKQDILRGIKGLYKKCLNLALKCKENKVDWWFRVGVLRDNFVDIIQMATMFPLWINRIYGIEVEKRIIRKIYDFCLNKDNVVIGEPQFYAITKMDKIMREGSSCNAGLRYFSITPEGLITPCHFIPEVIGDVKKVKSYKEVLEAGKRWRGKFTLGDSMCRNCPLFNLCGGGCFANSINRGKTVIADNLCFKREKIKEDEAKTEKLQRELEMSVNLPHLREIVSKKWIGC